MIFGHAEKFSKTCDFPLMEGEGAMARGVLKQGLLADRWLMNALAAYIVQPNTIRHIFGATGQENVGRFCIRIFEGRGWKTVFTDDRIPCDPIKHPLFLASSCDNECWPLIFEKGIAKSLGSFGHIATCGSRYDSTEIALKWISGGHVAKLNVLEYEWLTIAEEVTGRDGESLCRKLLSEGSNVSFGKSEPRKFHVPKQRKKNKKQKLSTSNWTFPFGRLFPLIGIEQIKHYKYFVFRDAWGLVPHVDMENSPEYGHPRTFKIRLEDIPAEFDTFFVVRYPDSIKAQVYKESKRLLMPRPYYIPWITEVLDQPYHDIRTPARFHIRVRDSPPEGVLGRKDSKKESADSPAVPVEIAITVSCLKSWADCCDLVDYAPPKLYGRLTATDETREALKGEGKVLEDVLDTTRPRHSRKIPSDFQPKTQTNMASENKPEDESVIFNAGASLLEASSSLVGESSSGATKDTAQLELEKDRMQYLEDIKGYDFPFCCQKSWASHSFKLWPGSYILSVYVEESHKVQTDIANGIKISSQSKLEDVEVNQQRTGDTPREVFVEKDPNKRGAWAHLSSIGNYSLNSLTPEEQEQNMNLLQYTCLSEMSKRGLPHEEKGPFLCEHQQESCSKGMMDVVARARREADELNLQLLELKHGNIVSVVMHPK